MKRKTYAVLIIIAFLFVALVIEWHIDNQKTKELIKLANKNNCELFDLRMELGVLQSSINDLNEQVTALRLKGDTSSLKFNWTDSVTVSDWIIIK